MKELIFKEAMPSKPIVYFGVSVTGLIGSILGTIYFKNVKALDGIVLGLMIIGFFMWLLVRGVRIVKNPRTIITINDEGIKYYVRRGYETKSWDELDKVWMLQGDGRKYHGHELMIKIGDDSEIVELQKININETQKAIDIYKIIRDKLIILGKQKDDPEVDSMIDYQLSGGEKEKDSGLRRVYLEDEII